MNWDLDINTLLQIASLACLAGMGWQKIGMIERDMTKLEDSFRSNIERLEAELLGYRDLKADLMVVKARLLDITDKLDKYLIEKK